MAKQAKRKSKDYTPVTVPLSVTPSGETDDRRKDKTAIDVWAHPAVWSDRMLTTLLENRVRGDKWHTLIDKVFSELNLFGSAHKVLGKKGAAGVDRQTVDDFAETEREELARLHKQLREDSYNPVAVRRVWISKPGSQQKRPLGIPTVRDRVVQTALLRVIEPILDHTFHERSFGFRHGRGCHDALRCVEGLLEKGYHWVVDADLKSYFDTIPKDRLLQLVKQQISDRRVLGLIKKYLDQGIVEELKTWTPEAGVPQGAVLSPVLSNVYLNPLDHEMSDKGYEMVRYADDFVILCRSRDEADAALSEVQRFVEAAGLELHPEKTHIVDSREKSFSFLGYSFRGRLRFPRAKSHQKLVDRIRELTPRKSGHSLEFTIKQLNQVLHGWFNYFRHCTWNIYRDYDGMIRRRLRRLLLKRHRLNPKRLSRTQRWPNQFFADAGLTSLNQCHMRFVQSLAGNY
jgi:RNA-directed DNA polymerase